MRLTIENGTMFVDNMFFGYVGAGDGCAGISNGTYPVSTQYAHKFGKDLPNASGLGWIGDDAECAIVVGRVRAGAGVLPCSGHLSRLLSLLEAAEDRGALVELVING